MNSVQGKVCQGFLCKTWTVANKIVLDFDILNTFHIFFPLWTGYL